MRVVVELTMPTESRFVSTTRRVLGCYLDDLGVSGDIRSDIILAVDEASANVVQHAYPGGQGVFRVRAAIGPDEVMIEVSDAGVGFQAVDQPTDPRGRLAVTGRGIDLMRRLMTTVDLESPTRSGGTRIRMSRSLQAVAGV